MDVHAGRALSHRGGGYLVSRGGDSVGPRNPSRGFRGGPPRGRMGFPPESTFPSLIVRKYFTFSPNVSQHFPKSRKMLALFPSHGTKTGTKTGSLTGFPYERATQTTRSVANLPPKISQFLTNFLPPSLPGGLRPPGATNRLVATPTPPGGEGWVMDFILLNSSPCL